MEVDRLLFVSIVALLPHISHPGIGVPRRRLPCPGPKLFWLERTSSTSAHSSWGKASYMTTPSFRNQEKPAGLSEAHGGHLRCQSGQGRVGGAENGNWKEAAAVLSQDDFLLFQIEFVPELPKTITGKIKRKELRIKEFSQRSATNPGASLWPDTGLWLLGVEMGWIVCSKGKFGGGKQKLPPTFLCFQIQLPPFLEVVCPFDGHRELSNLVCGQ